MRVQIAVLGFTVVSVRSTIMPDPVLPPSPQQQAGADREAGFIQVIGAVFWSFFGVRRKAAGERDMVTIKPLHVVVAGLLGAAIFIFVLIALVTVITRKG
jgi:hypothetical protein